MPAIPINIEDLLRAKTVESARLEFKASLSEPALRQVVATICAFANDFHNLNGGYIVLGVEEEGGVAKLPPAGLAEDSLEEMQKKIRGQCNRIEPEYYPVVEPIRFEHKTLLVIWCPAGEARPYSAPSARGTGERAYYIRQSSETVEAQGAILQELLSLTARIPFDDRANARLSYEVLEHSLIKKFLIDARSKLAEAGQGLLEDCLDLRIARRVNDHYAPVNVGLMFFTFSPHEYFAGARTEVAQFGDEAGGRVVEEKYFTGPIHEQIREILRFLEGITGHLTQKLPHKAEAMRFVAFPYAAMEEAVVNAFYHRGYDVSTEPIKIYLYPDRMEIISYPGPVPGILPEHFAEGARVPPAPNRNRRVGDFLKQLRLAEMRNTGIPTIIREMKQNGSPPPRFDFDASRTYFRVTLPAHLQYVVLHAIREAAYLWATGQKDAALHRLSESKAAAPSGILWAQLIEYKAESGDLEGAETEWKELLAQNGRIDRTPAAQAMARAYLVRGKPLKAAETLRYVDPSFADPSALTDVATLYRNAGDFESAHQLLENNRTLLWSDPKGLNELASIKFELAREAYRKRKKQLNQRLLEESAALYRRVIQLSPESKRCGWCWFRLAEIYQYLNKPDTEIEYAYEQAVALLPEEPEVQQQFQKWKKH
ncbi:MAG: putative DNA binding domain-containing protein [Saprospiraceae bacterium]|nr:putative DNA binding domain-containing protein [Saprospiraceae bacterium]MDW8228313.1 putative DNA binding domain-containing protein [Saprospiraceae bacterium]